MFIKKYLSENLSNKLQLLKFFFYIFPLMMLTSSGYITAYVSILTIFSLYCFYYYKIKINLIFLDYLIFIFFLVSVISTLLNIKELGSFLFLKSIFDLRFAIFFFVVRNIIDCKIINIKIFLIISLFSSFFLCINIFSQHIIGFDIFNHPPFHGRYNGLFESEGIAGSYIQKFSLASILSILTLRLNTKIIFILTILIINILSLGILMTLDRMPFIIFPFSIFILLIITKKFRLLFLTSLILIFFIFQLFFNNYVIIKNRYSSLANEINSIFFLNEKFKKKISPDQIYDKNSKLSGDYDYLKLYYSAYKIFLRNFLIGSGVKSFPFECYKLKKDNENIKCSSHPHNIYLEILVNQGVVGMLIFVTFLIVLFKKNYSNLSLSKDSNEKKLITLFFLTILFTELSPFRSYGSIFQTVNGSIFWFFLAFISSKPFIKK